MASRTGRKSVRKSARKTDRKSTRDQLLEAAKKELLAGGGDVELARVARRAGVSDGLTYYHFGNKAGLIEAVVDDFYRRLDDSVLAAVVEGESWAERERQRVHAMVDLFYGDPVAVIVATRLRTDPALVQEEAKRVARINELGARNIAQAQRDGEIDPGLDPLLLVSMILAGVTEGVRTALRAQPPLPVETAKQEIWHFVARAAGVA